jgi:hypothetical protein
MNERIIKTRKYSISFSHLFFQYEELFFRAFATILSVSLLSFNNLFNSILSHLMFAPSIISNQYSLSSASSTTILIFE